MGSDGVKTYDVQTGILTGPNFIPRNRENGFSAMLVFGTTLYAIHNGSKTITSGLALMGSRLYVANTNARAITVFDAATGALIDSHFISALDAPIYSSRWQLPAKSRGMTP